LGVRGRLRRPHTPKMVVSPDEKLAVTSVSVAELLYSANKRLYKT
jgi:predicted nucleic acid-binding protein